MPEEMNHNRPAHDVSTCSSDPFTYPSTDNNVLSTFGDVQLSSTAPSARVSRADSPDPSDELDTSLGGALGVDQEPLSDQYAQQQQQQRQQIQRETLLAEQRKLAEELKAYETAQFEEQLETQRKKLLERNRELHEELVRYKRKQSVQQPQNAAASSSSRLLSVPPNASSLPSVNVTSADLSDQPDTLFVHSQFNDGLTIEDIPPPASAPVGN